MGRILAIDYGRKRTGLAVTDILRIVPNGLTTIASHTLIQYLDDYMKREDVDIIVVGHPKQMNNQESESWKYIKPMLDKLKQKFPTKEIVLYDERFTSKLAQKAILDMGIKKQRRQSDKSLIDEISATIILRDYMESKL